MAQLFVENVSKVFDGLSSPVTALQNASLRVGDGEFVSILGPSGCGKSTLLFLIAGLDMPSSGRIASNGEVVTGTARSRHVVFQDSALFPWRTALENVTIGLEGRMSKKSAASIAREHIALMGLTGFEDAFPRQLSGGMRQRVAIARALAMEPTVLLMDEPFAAVDTLTRERLQEELLRIWEIKRTTILFVTHGIDEAIFLSQRIVVMTPRPGTIREIVEVNAGYPRTYLFRSDPIAARLRTQLYQRFQNDSGE